MTSLRSFSPRRLALLQSIADIQPDPLFVLDTDGNYLDCIGGTDRNLYDDPSFLVGLNMRDVLPPHVVQQFLDSISQALETDSLVVVEYALSNAQVDGSAHEGPNDTQWFEGRVVPLDWMENGRRCVAWLAINISARKQAENALRESEARLRDLSEVLLTAERLAKVLSWEWDLATDHWTALSGERGILDLAPATTTSAELMKHIHPDDRSMVDETLAVAFGGAPFDIQHRVINPETGEIRHVRSYGTLIRDETDKPVKLRGATQDITEQRAIDEKVRQAENLRIAGQLSGGFAHEFNNLLQILMGNIDLARDHKKYDARMVRLLNSAREAIRRGKDLTESLLSFSRQQELVPTPVDPGDLIRATLDMLAPSLCETIRLETEIADRLPRITIDVPGLETAILNIALNAAKAMPWGGTLSIRASLTHLGTILKAGAEVLAPGSYLEIAVADTGCGMPEEVLARACEPFFTTREVGQGTGLGLSMVQGFVRQSNGALTLDSRMGEGTTARLLLPVTEAHDGSGDEIPKSVRLVEEVPS